MKKSKGQTLLLKLLVVHL